MIHCGFPRKCHFFFFFYLEAAVWWFCLSVSDSSETQTYRKDPHVDK